jgi:hypothetical protein
MAQELRCEVCSATAVRLARRESSGTEVWRCGNCGDAKRWCPRCDQGWVRHVYADADKSDFYSCDECEATWATPEEIRGTGTDLTTFLRRTGKPWSYKDLTVLRDSEPSGSVG